MDRITILQTLIKWAPAALGTGALLALTAFALLAALGKRRRGRAVPSKAQFVSLFLLLCWAAMVGLLTMVSRGANYAGSVNFHLFSGYVRAWNQWSPREFQLILLNMLMFAPLGFLLPLLWKRAERFGVILLASLGASALVEIAQLVSGRGIFEFDDLLHNCLGSLFGYFCIMAILACRRKGRMCPAPIARALVLPILVGSVFGGAALAYSHQPYGNMPFAPAVRQDMSSVNVEAALTLPDVPASAPVYRNLRACEDAQPEDIRAALAELERAALSSAPRREENSLIFTGKTESGEEAQLTFFTRTGTWDYTTWTDPAPLPDAEAESLRTRYEAWFTERGLLPENARFSLQNGDTLRWDARAQDPPLAGLPSFAEGTILLQFDARGNACSLFYEIYWNEFAATEAIISPSDALAQVRKGQFEQYVPFKDEDTLHISACELGYAYDTKGFYRPVYQFSGYVNDVSTPWSCQIPAM